MAAAFNELMSRLGYDRYGVHGNDGGAIVSPRDGPPGAYPDCSASA